MTSLAIILPQPEDKLLGALVFQKCKDFKVYVPENWAEADDYQEKLTLRTGSLPQVLEPFVCVLEPGAVPDQNFVKRVLRSIMRHYEYDVYHVNLTEGKAFPRKVKDTKLFKLLLVEGREAPLSSFIFRTLVLQEKAVLRADGSLDPLPCVFSCCNRYPVRNIWRQKLEWKAPTLPQDPASVEKRILDKLDLYRWTERYFGDADYPLGVGDSLELYAQTLVQLYPSYSPEELKEIMSGFQAAQGPIRKMRAASALKSALKQRQKELGVKA